MSPFWRSKSTRQTGRPGAARAAASARWIATVVVPTPPLAPATAIRLPASAPTAVSSPETRSRSARDHWAAARTLDSSCSSESGSETTSRMPGLHRRAHQRPGESSAASSTIPTSGKLAAISRASSITGHGAERVVQHDDVDVEPAQRARQLLGVVDDRSTTSSSSLSAASAAAPEASVRVADRDQQPLAHWAAPGSVGGTRAASSSARTRSPGRSSARRTLGGERSA